MAALSRLAILDEFDSTADAVYTECSSGISKLDRLIVAAPSELADDARAAFLPALYAYWERFFKTVYGEYLRCVSLTQPELRDLTTSLVALRLRIALTTKHLTRPSLLLERLHKHGVAECEKASIELHSDATAVSSLFKVPVEFVDPEACIVTESNVRYSVLENATRTCGLSLAPLCRYLRYTPESNLRDLVELRNSIAHGDTIQPITSETWEKLRSFTLELMNAVQLVLRDGLEGGLFLAQRDAS